MTELNEETLDAADAIDAEEQLAEAIQTSALVSIHKLTPLEAYKPGNIDAVISAIKTEVKSFTADPSTKKGREAIASMAHKVARSKTFLDDLGKTLGEDTRKALDLINAERKKVRDSLDNLKSEVRKPLDQWEAAEMIRVNKHKSMISTIRDLGSKCERDWQKLPIEEIQSNLELLKTNDQNFEEFHGEAQGALADSINRITAALKNKSDFEEQRLELERLRKADADRKAKEDEERAIAQAKADAEKAAREKEEKAVKDAEAVKLREDNEKLKADKDKADAEVARLQKIADDKIAADKKAAEEKAAEERREASKRHVKKIMNETAASIHAVVKELTEVQIIKITEAIAKGEIKNVTIKY